MLASPEPLPSLKQIRGVSGGVLVVATILEESPHRPDITVEFAAEFDAVATALPA